MEQVSALKDSLPDPAKDLRINFGNVLESEHLAPPQVWGIALASAYFLREDRLRDAIAADAAGHIEDKVRQDAQAAASLMGMNTVFYRFRHLVGKESYAQLPARLRMQWMARPLTSKVDFELFSLACAALAGCESCIRAHEAAVIKGGLSEQHVQDTIRIAATLQGVAVALHLEQAGD